MNWRLIEAAHRRLGRHRVHSASMTSGMVVVRTQTRNSAR